jgi:hypothetical protein
MTAVVSALVLLAAMGCGKDSDTGEARAMLPPAMDVTEVELGAQACAAYAQRVCACASAKPDDTELADQCHMDRTKALDMVLEVHRTTESADERIKTERTARRMMASCIEDQSKLDSRGCPRSSSP